MKHPISVDVRATVLRESLLTFLRGLEIAVPPPPNCHHALTFARYGSDEVGWVDKLALQINHEGKFYCFFMDEGDDLIDGMIAVIDDVKNGLANKEALQQGVALGQYSKDVSDEG